MTTKDINIPRAQDSVSDLLQQSIQNGYYATAALNRIDSFFAACYEVDAQVDINSMMSLGRLIAEDYRETVGVENEKIEHAFFQLNKASQGGAQ